MRGDGKGSVFFEKLRGAEGIVSIKTVDTRTGEVKEEVHKNLVVTSGLNMIAQFLVSTTPAVAGIQFLGIGTGSSSVVAANTQLETEFRRLPVSEATVDGAMAIFSFEIADSSELTFREMGLFMNSATATLGSGIMYNRLVLPTNAVKNSFEHILIEWRLRMKREGE